MKTLKFVFFAGVFIIGAINAKALISYGLDNSSNISPTNESLPFQTVAQIYTPNSNGVLSLVGSAVYLQNGYFITANHVTTSAASKITFDGITFYDFASYYSPTTVASGVDLKIFNVENEFIDTISENAIYTKTLSSSASVYLVGGGKGRSSSEVNTSEVTWGNISTADIRWGTNNILSSLTAKSVLAENYNSTYYYTTLSSNALSSEAGLVTYDSGGAMFYADASNNYYIAGIAANVFSHAVEISTFSTSTLSSDINGFVNLSLYADAINAMTASKPVNPSIPEADNFAALMSIIVLAALRLRRR